MVANVPAKRGRKPATAAAPATGQVQSLTRGLKLLEWIAESHNSVALTELAQQAGLPNSTTHRLLTTMQQLGFVRDQLIPERVVQRFVIAQDDQVALFGLQTDRMGGDRCQ